MGRFSMPVITISLGIVNALLTFQSVPAQETKVVKADAQIDALDGGIKLFVREKMAEGNTRFMNDNIVLFLHGGFMRPQNAASSSQMPPTSFCLRRTGSSSSKKCKNF